MFSDRQVASLVYTEQNMAAAARVVSPFLGIYLSI